MRYVESQRESSRSESPFPEVGYIEAQSAHEIGGQYGGGVKRDKIRGQCYKQVGGVGDYAAAVLFDRDASYSHSAENGGGGVRQFVGQHV